jgi:hypothetical protein
MGNPSRGFSLDRSYKSISINDLARFTRQYLVLFSSRDLAACWTFSIVDLDACPPSGSPNRLAHVGLANLCLYRDSVSGSPSGRLLYV